MRRRGRILEKTRRAISRSLALVFVLAMIVGILRAGSTYLYCPFMGAMAVDACCSHATTERSTVDRNDCCELHRLPSLPNSESVSTRVAVAPSPLVAIIAPEIFIAPELAVGTRDDFAVPTGPPILGAPERAAHLSVYRL